MRDAGQLVTGKLLRNKLINGFVVVERTDNVVAIFVGIRARRIGVAVAIGVGVTGNVEPVKVIEPAPGGTAVWVSGIVVKTSPPV